VEVGAGAGVAVTTTISFVTTTSRVTRMTGVGEACIAVGVDVAGEAATG
jgi:hypothetical protein